jgi:glycine cleavage system aminomethyltransferase T
MSLAAEVKALRSSSGFSVQSHVAIVQVSGAGALDLLQVSCTQSPHVRVGRVRHTLFLCENGSVFADVLVVNLGDWFLVLAEGPTEAEIVAWLSSLTDRVSGKDVSIRGLVDEWIAFGIDGPWAWEVVSGLLGPAVLGMPYLTVLARDETICLRAGKTGEYGYLLLVPRPNASEVETRLLEVGGPLDMTPVGLEALDVCALESWHFTMRTLGATDKASPLTPIELQLQWRVGYTRDFVGAEALRAHKARVRESPDKASVRVTCFTAGDPVLPRQRIHLGDADVGEGIASCVSPTLGLTVGAALLSERFAHPHLSLVAMAPERPIPLRTCPAFLVENLSLHVQPHLGHTYATRGERP